MSPALTKNEFTDGIMAETKFSAKNGHSLASGMTGSYFEDDFLGQSLGVAPILEGMSHVGFPGGPLKIGPDVVSPDKIQMIDHWEIVGIGDKSQGNKTVNAEVLSCKSDAQISIFVGVWGQYPFWSWPQRNLASPQKSISASQTPHSTKVGNFIDPLMAGDGAPFFIHNPTYIPGSGVCQHKGAN